MCLSFRFYVFLEDAHSVERGRRSEVEEIDSVD